MDYYAADLLDESRHPSNFVEWEGLPEEVCHNASCGDSLAVRFAVADGRVQQLQWHGQGCALSLAAASVLSRRFEGENIENVAQFTFYDVQRELHLEQVSLGRVKCLTLFLQCVQRQLAATDQRKSTETAETVRGDQ